MFDAPAAVATLVAKDLECGAPFFVAVEELTEASDFRFRELGDESWS